MSITFGNTITPGADGNSLYPTHVDKYGKGGLITLDQVASISAIAFLRQSLGMLIYAQDTAMYYAVTSISSPLTGYTPLISLSGGLLKSSLANVDLGQIPSLSGNWNSVYTSVCSNSANWQSAYNTLNSLSGNWQNAISTINGTANQIIATASGNNTYTLGLANDITIPGNFIINGTFTANGSATFINTNNLVVNDNIIYINQGATGNTLDTGFVSHFTPASGNYNHTGLIRKAGQGTPGIWTLFSGLTTEPLTSSNINWSDTTFTLDTLNANINAPIVNTNNLNVSLAYTTFNNGGNVWIPKESSRYWTSIAMSSDGTKQTAVASQGSNIYISNDSGTTWTPTASAKYWTGIAMSSDGTKQTAVAGVFNDNIYISNDSGATWTPTASANFWRAVAMSSDGTKQTAVATNSGKIYISNNSGATWTPTASAKDWRAVAMSSDGTKQTAIVTGELIYISNDSGTTWTPTASAKYWTGIAMSSDGTKQTAVANGDLIYISNDSGTTWTPKASANGWLSVAISSDGIVQTAVANPGLIFISTDSGNTWTAKESRRSWTGIAMSSDGKQQTAVGTSTQIYVSPKTYTTSSGGSLSALSAFVTTLTANSIFVSQLTCANTIYANGGNSNLWNSAYNTVNIINSNYLQDAQSNNLLYARYNGSWVAFTPGTPYNQTLNTFDNVLFSNLTIANSISSNSIISNSVNSNSVNSLVCNTTNLSSKNFSSTNITGTNYFGTITTKKIILNSFPSNAQNITSGLMAYWSFNASSGGNPLYDNTGNGNTLTNRGAVLVEGIFDGLQIPATTLFDGAYLFNNSLMVADYSTVHTYPEPYTSFDFSGDFGISFWIKPKTSATNLIQPIIYGENYSNVYSNYYYGGINIALQNNTLIVSDYTNISDPANPDSTILTSSSQLSTNIWSHVAITRNAGDIALYIDGVKVGESSTVIDYSCQQLYFGAYSDSLISDGLNYGSNHTPFIGVMDEIGLWTRGLTSGEITALYNNRNGATYPFNYQLNLSLGGTIDTTGQGAIEFGQDGNKTTLVGTASGDITIQLPGVSGTLITDSILNPTNANSVYSTVQSTSANWQSVYSTVQSTSANWQSVYSTVQSTSANWQSVYSTVRSASANWSGVYTTTLSNSANWNAAYSSLSTQPYTFITSTSSVLPLYGNNAIPLASNTISVSSGLSAYWTLDNSSWLDSTGNGNVLTNTGSVTTSAGILSSAASFNGTNYLSTTAIKIGASNFTFSAWIYPATNSATYGILGQGTNGIGSYAFIRGGGGNIRFEMFVGNNIVTASNLAPAGKWTHCAVTSNSGNISIYVNGVLAATGTNAINLNIANFYIGNHPWLPFKFVGLIDEVGVWNRALTQTEITYLYNYGRALAYPLTVLPGSNNYILGGTNNNIVAGSNNYILGSNFYITSANNTVFVNNLSSSGVLYDAIGNSNQWNNVCTFVTNNSSGWGSSNATISLPQSANWNSVYNTVNSLSSGWGNATVSLPQSANWNSVYNTVNSLSSVWGSGTTDAAVRSLTGNWQNVYSLVAANSSIWGTGGVGGGTNSALTSSYVFTGNGSVSSFNLGSTIPFTAASNYIVSLNGVLQTPYVDYNITYNNGANYLNTLFVPRNNSTISVISINNSSNTNVSFSTVSASQFYGNASTANKLVSSVTISLVGSVVGSASFDGSSNITITTTSSAGSVGTTGVGLSSKRIISSGNVNQTLKYQTYLIDTRSNSVTANLPLSAQPGDFIAYQDMYRTWNKNNFVINNTTYKLQGFDEPMICNLPGLTISLTYLDDTLGWYVD